MHFAHTALSVLINFSMGFKGKIHWRKHLDEYRFPVDFKLFYEAAIHGIKDGFVRNVLYQKPEKIPPFLKHLKTPAEWQRTVTGGELTLKF